MVNKERVKLLVDALRSGDFEQAANALTIVKGVGSDVKTSHCCLGVACQVAMANDLEVEAKLGKMLVSGEEIDVILYRTPETIDIDGKSFEGSYLPEGVKDWFGFISISPTVVLENGTQTTAVSANDTYKLSFNQIADAFEREYLND